MTLASWDNVAATRVDDLAYNVDSDPQYWAVYLNFPTPSSVDYVSFQTPPVAERRLIQVTYFAEIIDVDSTVNSAGFLFAELLFSSQGLFGTQTSVVPTSLGNSFPTLNSYSSWTAGGDGYDPISLPVGGVNYPIWTRALIDPLTAVVDLDAAPYGPLWGETVVQVNGTINTVTNAATVRQTMTWAPVNDAQYTP